MDGPQLFDPALAPVVERCFGFDGRIFHEQGPDFTGGSGAVNLLHLAHDALVTPGLPALLVMGADPRANIDAFANVQQRPAGIIKAIDTAVPRQFFQRLARCRERDVFQFPWHGLND